MLLDWHFDSVISLGFFFCALKDANIIKDCLAHKLLLIILNLVVLYVWYYFFFVERLPEI